MSDAAASIGEHDHEPVRGLPGRLPADETILWQGAPRASALARHGFHIGGLAIYFGLLLAWCGARLVMQGTTGLAFAAYMLNLGGLALAALGLIAMFSWLVGRSTVYTITNRRIAMRFGVAFSMTLNVPFSVIERAEVRRFADGSGDLPLTLSASTGMGYFVLWPHVRPWRMSRAPPKLRAIPEVDPVAVLGGRALAAACAPPATAGPTLAPTAPAGAGLPGVTAAAA